MDNTIPRVILIHSKSVQVVDAKLKVYKTFKSYMDQGHIFIHHEYEDNDDIARWIACEHIVQSCAYLESIRASISETHLVSVLDDAFNNSFTQENIRELCYKIFIQTKDETVGAVGSQSYVCRYSRNVQYFKRILVEETINRTSQFLGTKICSGILYHMEAMVQDKIMNLTKRQFSDERHEHRPEFEFSDESHEHRPGFEFSDESHGHRPQYQTFDESHARRPGFELFDEIHRPRYPIFAERYARRPRFQFPEEMHERIQFSIQAIIISVIATAAGFIISIGVFFITIIYPVDINSKVWRKKIADEVFDKIRASRSTLKAEILQEMESICSNTSDDLQYILAKLKEFKLEVSPMDQSQFIKEWMERENIAKNKARLEENKSFLQYIAGYNSVGNTVVKVFLRGKEPIEEENPDIEKIRKCFDISTDFILDLVYTGTKPEDIMQNVNKIRDLERKNSVFDNETKANLKKIIQKYEDEIYARYSAVIGIGMSQVRFDKETLVIEPCIVLYCLDRKLIPFGEKPLPKKIENWSCDIREDFVMFGHCPTACPASNGNLPEPGCSIGLAEVKSTGSVGFLVEFNNEFGFLTASHVVVRNFEYFYNEEITFLYPTHQSNRDVIVHPSKEDCQRANLEVGEVVQSFFGNYESRALDLALVKCNSPRKEDKKRLTVVGFDDMNTNDDLKVQKTGRTTGRTEGYLKDTIPSVSVKDFKFKNCYHVVTIDDTDFFKEGDSGSGVFLVQGEEMTKPVGIAFAFMNYSAHTFVCSIDAVIDRLRLSLVMYPKENELCTNYSQNNTVSESMDCSN